MNHYDVLGGRRVFNSAWEKKRDADSEESDVVLAIDDIGLEHHFKWFHLVLQQLKIAGPSQQRK